ncbi:MAG TPA: hypothetical protein VHT04_12480 [Stellaceae bacterium]|jgi:hypothetical protein|nr:hypothetical protein [Stellaceae bacterium]
MNERNSKRSDDERNRRAAHVNPTKSGIRTGNPQLDPDRAGKSDDAGAGEEKKRHRPNT